MTMNCCTLNFPVVLLGSINKNKTQYNIRSNPSLATQISSLPLHSEDSANALGCSRNWSSAIAQGGCQAPTSLLIQRNTVGIIGGVSVFSTLIFLEKLVRWSSKDGQECLPFVVCSDPALRKELPVVRSFHSSVGGNYKIEFNHGKIVGNLRRKRVFLEQSGARCIVMPCHLSHAWYGEISEGCSLPFLHVGDAVAWELSQAKFRPREVGSDVRIGILATHATSIAGFYQEKLRNQGFEVVLPDQATMAHIVIPAIESFYRRDIEGARNLLRIAIQVLLMRAVNAVILASDEMQCLLPHDDPLLKRCIDPMDALVRSTIKWAKSAPEAGGQKENIKEQQRDIAELVSLCTLKHEKEKELDPGRG